ncbi:Sphingomyelin phosphodiesterase [Entamoeba marina]
MQQCSLYKIVLVGDSSVGKTSLLHQYITKTFKTQTKSTVGADFVTREIEVNQQIIALQLWDTAGNERFCSLGPVFFRGADCCILVCDVTNTASLQNLSDWKKQMLSNVSADDTADFPFVVVGNKSDCADNERDITSDELSHWNEGAYPTFECSAKTGWNVDNLFNEVAQIVYKKTKIDNNQTGIQICELNKNEKKSCC